MRPAAGDQIGPYVLVRRIGQGGMGSVYQARSPEGTIVALKVPFDTLLDDPGTRARYTRELEVSRALDHPNVQRLLDSGESDGTPYAVLEWIDGGLLREHLYHGRPLDIDESVRLAGQLCDALEYCHANGIVHRDLKPDNVLVTKDGQVKLMDFGAALLEGARKITTASLSPALGTPDYMSPEQVQGKRGDARSDIYALGVMLYEMLTGSPPYSGDSALAVMAQHVQSSPAPVRSRNRKVPVALGAVVGKALRRDPAARYQTAASLAHDLRNLDSVDVAKLESEAARDGSVEVQRRPRKNQGAAVALVVAGLATAALIFAASVQLAGAL